MIDPDWLARFHADAQAAQDGPRLRLFDLSWQADQHRETDPERMLALLVEGRNLARRLREPWWELFYEDRRAGALMKYKGDVATGLELAVRNALEARKPLYDGFPWRFALHDHLVVAYLNTDPVGHAAKITEALDWLEGEAPHDGSPRYLVLARRRWLYDELGAYDQAEEMARRSLALAEDDPDQDTARSHSVFCFSHLCAIAWTRRDWQALAERVDPGEELARQVGLQLELAEFIMWRGVLARREGDADFAERLWGQSCRRVAQLGMPPDHIWFDALCAYHELGGELEAMLGGRDRELALLTERGRYAAECRCRVERCRLLRRLSRPLDDELQAARAAAARLQQPRSILDALERIERQNDDRA